MIVGCKQCLPGMSSDTPLQCVSIAFISLLVFTTVIVSTILAFNPIILLNIAQLDTGHRDFIIKTNASCFNATKVAQLTSLSPMPRVKSRMILDNGKTAVGWFMDFHKETELGLGFINAEDSSLNGSLFAHSSLGLKEGQKVTLFMENNQLIGIIADLVANGTIRFKEALKISEQLKTLEASKLKLGGSFIISKVFEGSMDKMGAAQAEGCIFLDIRSAFAAIIKQTFGRNSAFMQLVSSSTFKLQEFATEATINFPNRIEIYSNADSQTILRTIQAYGQRIALSLGLFSLNVQMPIYGKLQGLKYLGMLIGVTLKGIVVSMFILSVLMLSNALQMSVDQQRANMAIFKVVGASRAHVGMHILTGAVKQVFLANLVAYPLIYLAFQLIEETVQAYIGNTTSLTFTYDACTAGILIGMLVPLMASASPIISVVKNDLAQSLGQGKINYSDVKTEIYVQGQEFPWGKLAFGVVATVYGLCIYYLLPKALINQNLGLLITLFFLFIEGLLVGLIVLSYSFEYLLEGLMARVLLFWVSPTEFSLTYKNLSSHRLQNRKSSLIYALAVSFVITIAVSFQLQIDATKDEYLQYMGGDIDIGGDYVNPQFINRVVAELPSIESLTYMSDTLGDYLKKKGVKKVMLSDKAKLFFLQDSIYAIAGPLLPKDNKNGRQILYTQSQQPHNIYTHLDTEKGFGTCIMGQYTAKKLGIIQSHSRQFYLNIYYKDSVRRIPLNYSSVVSKRKGMYYTGYPLPSSQVTISADTFRMLAGIETREMPWIRAKLYVKDDSLLPVIVDRIKQRISTNTEFSQKISFTWSRIGTDAAFAEIKRMLNGIMLFLLVVLLILCFFSLLTTTHANVRTQQKEIAVLLVLGYAKVNILKIYAYEAFVVVVNACCKGFAAGYIMAVVTAWQRELFSSVIVHLRFKGEFLGVIFVMAVVSSLLATYREVKQTVNKKMTNLLNGVN